MKILVTGGAGYIGMELCYSLAQLAEVQEVVIFDRLNRNNYNMFCGERKFTGARLVLIEDDILNSRALGKAVSSADIIFHLAAQTPTQNFLGSSHIFEQTNHWGTASLVEAVKRNPGNKRLINLSSLAVYGQCNIEKIDQQPKPEDPYTISKLRGESHVFELLDFQNHSFINVRCPIVFGYSKNLRIDQAVNRMVFDAKMRGRIQIFGDSSINAPHIYIKQLVDTLMALALSSETGATVIPASTSISGLEIFENLQLKIPGLEAVFVDQAAYTSEIKLSEEVETFSGPSQPSQLRSQLSEFLDSFIN